MELEEEEKRRGLRKRKDKLSGRGVDGMSVKGEEWGESTSNSSVGGGLIVGADSARHSSWRLIARCEVLGGGSDRGKARKFSEVSETQGRDALCD